MEQKTAEFVKKFEELKNMLVNRAASSLGEAALKLFLSLIDGYQEEVLKALDCLEKTATAARDENTLLLGLVGAGNTEFRAKLIAQTGELRFLRQEVLDLRKSSGEAAKKHDALSVEIERLKNELAASLKAREKDQQDFDKRAGEFGKILKNYDEKIMSGQAELNGRKEEFEIKIRGVSKEIEAQSEQAVKRAVIRLNNLCVEIEEASSVFKEEMEKLRNERLAAPKKKPGIFQGKEQQAITPLPALPSFDLLTEKVAETVSLLKKYMETFTLAEIKPARVNFNKLFDDLKARYSSSASPKKIKLSFQPAKMPADFVSDQALLLKAFSAVVQNAIEALSSEGAVDINLSFEKNRGTAVITDTGKEIRPEHREMLFLPLFTTKSSHYGLGLVNCRRILRSLGGDVVYEPVKNGNAFRLTFYAVENKTSR